MTTDLGLDQVIVYRFDPSKGGLALNAPPFARLPPGSGPRHLAFHPTAKYVYVNSETDSTVSALTYDAKTGTLKGFQTMSTLPAGFSGTNTTAEIQVDRAGRFLYVSNRGHDSIAIFAIDQASGTLTPVDHVPTTWRTPRYFTFDPTGAYLLAGNQGSAPRVESEVVRDYLTHLARSRSCTRTCSLAPSAVNSGLCVNLSRGYWRGGWRARPLPRRRAIHRSTASR